MPEIKIKHVISFNTEVNVLKDESLLKPETGRNWICANPCEKRLFVKLQFEKPMNIHSIVLGNENCAFVEVFVGRWSDSGNDYKVLLEASSFMSHLKSRNVTQNNHQVCMFGPEAFSKNTRDKLWDSVQVVCTQPINKNIKYGLNFIKFYSPPENCEEQSNAAKEEESITKLDVLKIKEEDHDAVPTTSWFEKQRTKVSENSSAITIDQAAPSYVTAVSSTSNASEVSSQDNSLKRKIEEINAASEEPPDKKISLNEEDNVYEDELCDTHENKVSDTDDNIKIGVQSPKVEENEKEPATLIVSNIQDTNNILAIPSTLKVPFNKILDQVVIVLSGFLNPLRSELRDKAREMGAKYKPYWNVSCTHLVCAFVNTPKYREVKRWNGRIVTKEWILDCHKLKEPLPWQRYQLSTGSSAVHDDSDNNPNNDDKDDEECVDTKQIPLTNVQNRKITIVPDTKNSQSTNAGNQATNDIGSSSIDALSNTQAKKCTASDTSQFSTALNTKDDSEKAYQEALLLKQLLSYIDDKDSKDDSGGDTKDEIHKVEAKDQKKEVKMNGMNKDIESFSKLDASNQPLSELPDIFKQRRFFLYGDIPSTKLQELKQYITAYNGIIEDFMSDKIKYVITEKKWDSNFEDILSVNEDVVFVKPTWIYKCHEARKLVPYQLYIVTPVT